AQVVYGLVRHRHGPVRHRLLSADLSLVATLSAARHPGTVDAVRSAPAPGRGPAAPLVRRGRALARRAGHAAGVLPRPALDGRGWLGRRSARPPRAGPGLWTSPRRPQRRRVPPSPSRGAVRARHPCLLALPAQAAETGRAHHGRTPAALSDRRHAAV